MINHEHKLVFIQMHKTGGASISQALQQQGLAPTTPYHQPLSYYCRTLGQDRIADYFCFTVVRNPWDRAFSVYNYLRSRSDENMAEVERMCKQGLLPGNSSSHRTSIIRARTNNFSDFVKDSIDDPVNDSSYPNLFRFSWFLDTNISINTFIIRFETIQNDFDLLCERIGLAKSELPRIDHGSHHEHYSLNYDAATRSRIAKYCSADIKNYGYKFDDDKSTTGITESSACSVHQIEE